MNLCHQPWILLLKIVPQLGNLHNHSSTIVAIYANTAVKHSFIHPFSPVPSVMGGSCTGANRTCQWVNIRAHPGRVTDIHTQIHSYGKFRESNELMPACFCRCTMYQVLNDQSPFSLQYPFKPYHSTRPLCSRGLDLLVVHRISKTKMGGMVSFYYKASLL